MQNFPSDNISEITSTTAPRFPRSDIILQQRKMKQKFLLRRFARDPYCCLNAICARCLVLCGCHCAPFLVGLPCYFVTICARSFFLYLHIWQAILSAVLTRFARDPSCYFETICARSFSCFRDLLCCCGMKGAWFSLVLLYYLRVVPSAGLVQFACDPACSVGIICVCFLVLPWSFMSYNTWDKRIGLYDVFSLGCYGRSTCFAENWWYNTGRHGTAAAQFRAFLFSSKQGWI